MKLMREGVAHQRSECPKSLGWPPIVKRRRGDFIWDGGRSRRYLWMRVLGS